MKLSQTPEGLALRNKVREDFEKALGLPPGAFGRVGPRPMTAAERAEMLRSLLQHPEEGAYRRIVKQTIEMGLRAMREKLSQSPEAFVIRRRMREAMQEVAGPGVDVEPLNAPPTKQVVPPTRPKTWFELKQADRWKALEERNREWERQKENDKWWEKHLAEERGLAREDAKQCHRGRGDPDFDERSEVDPLGLWRR